MIIAMCRPMKNGLFLAVALPLLKNLVFTDYGVKNWHHKLSGANVSVRVNVPLKLFVRQEPMLLINAKLRQAGCVGAQPGEMS